MGKSILLNGKKVNWDGTLDTEGFFSWDEDKGLKFLRFDFGIIDKESNRENVASATVWVADPEYITSPLTILSDSESADYLTACVTLERYVANNYSIEGLPIEEIMGVVAYIDKIEVKSELRGKGIGHEAVKVLVEWLRRERVNIAVLLAIPFEIKDPTPEEKQHLVNFYESLDFEHIHESEDSMFMIIQKSEPMEFYGTDVEIE